LHELKAGIQQRDAYFCLGQWWPQVFANEAMLKLVVTNLLANAVTYVPPERRPEIIITARLENGRALLRVEDNGIGIPQEHVNRVFKPFVRLPNPLATPGMGMGLAMAKKASERMNGRIGVESTPDKGSCFWLELSAA